MNAIQIHRYRPDPGTIGRASVSIPSPGSSDISQIIAKRLTGLAQPTPTFWGGRATPAKGLDEQLYDALATFKVHTASVAMHLDRDWRTKLFRQLDSLLALEDWQADDAPPSAASYTTFLRMLTLLRPGRRPGLGATENGHLIATWTVGDDHLTVECLPRDIVRWHLATTVEGERERAAAETPLQRLKEVLQPYDPQHWFDNADNLPAA